MKINRSNLLFGQREFTGALSSYFNVDRLITAASGFKLQSWYDVINIDSYQEYNFVASLVPMSWLDAISGNYDYFMSYEALGVDLTTAIDTTVLSTNGTCGYVNNIVYNYKGYLQSHKEIFPKQTLPYARAKEAYYTPLSHFRYNFDQSKVEFIGSDANVVFFLAGDNFTGISDSYVFISNSNGYLFIYDKTTETVIKRIYLNESIDKILFASDDYVVIRKDVTGIVVYNIKDDETFNLLYSYTIIDATAIDDTNIALIAKFNNNIYLFKLDLTTNVITKRYQIVTTEDFIFVNVNLFGIVNDTIYVYLILDNEHSLYMFNTDNLSVVKHLTKEKSQIVYSLEMTEIRNIITTVMHNNTLIIFYVTQNAAGEQQLNTFIVNLGFTRFIAGKESATIALASPFVDDNDINYVSLYKDDQYIYICNIDGHCYVYDIETSKFITAFRGFINSDNTYSPQPTNQINKNGAIIYDGVFYGISANNLIIKQLNINENNSSNAELNSIEKSTTEYNTYTANCDSINEYSQCGVFVYLKRALPIASIDSNTVSFLVDNLTYGTSLNLVYKTYDIFYGDSKSIYLIDRIAYFDIIRLGVIKVIDNNIYLNDNIIATQIDINNIIALDVYPFANEYVIAIADDTNIVKVFKSSYDSITEIDVGNNIIYVAFVTATVLLVVSNDSSNHTHVQFYNVLTGGEITNTDTGIQFTNAYYHDGRVILFADNSAVLYTITDDYSIDDNSVEYQNFKAFTRDFAFIASNNYDDQISVWATIPNITFTLDTNIDIKSFTHDGYLICADGDWLYIYDWMYKTKLAKAFLGNSISDISYYRGYIYYKDSNLAIYRYKIINNEAEYTYAPIENTFLGDGLSRFYNEDGDKGYNTYPSISTENAAVYYNSEVNAYILKNNYIINYADNASYHIIATLNIFKYLQYNNVVLLVKNTIYSDIIIILIITDKYVIKARKDMSTDSISYEIFELMHDIGVLSLIAKDTDTYYLISSKYSSPIKLNSDTLQNTPIITIVDNIETDNNYSDSNNYYLVGFDVSSNIYVSNGSVINNTVNEYTLPVRLDLLPAHKNRTYYAMSITAESKPILYTKEGTYEYEYNVGGSSLNLINMYTAKDIVETQNYIVYQGVSDINSITDVKQLIIAKKNNNYSTSSERKKYPVQYSLVLNIDNGVRVGGITTYEPHYALLLRQYVYEVLLRTDVLFDSVDDVDGIFIDIWYAKLNSSNEIEEYSSIRFNDAVSSDYIIERLNTLIQESKNTDFMYVPLSVIRIVPIQVEPIAISNVTVISTAYQNAIFSIDENTVYNLRPSEYNQYENTDIYDIYNLRRTHTIYNIFDDAVQTNGILSLTPPILSKIDSFILSQEES